jgi:hypothetical protein
MLLKKGTYKTSLLSSPLDKLHHDYELFGKYMAVLWLRPSVVGPSPPRHGFNVRLDHMEFVVNTVALGQVIPWNSSVSIIPPMPHTHSSITELTRNNNTARSAVYFWSQAYIVS